MKDVSITLTTTPEL